MKIEETQSVTRKKGKPHLSCLNYSAFFGLFLRNLLNGFGAKNVYIVVVWQITRKGAICKSFCV